MPEYFQQVGPRVEFGQVGITPAEADRFRRVTLEGVKVKRLEISDIATFIMTTSYATGVLSNAAGDYEVDEASFYAKNIGQQNPDYWRSVITFARYNQKHADTKIYNIYETEWSGGEVVSAVRRVRVIRNLTRIAFDESGDPYEDVYSRQYKAFEAPMTGEDVTIVEDRVRRTMARQRVMQK
jgi:hypothetical protein